jgi:hypothetical protein
MYDSAQEAVAVRKSATSGSAHGQPTPMPSHNVFGASYVRAN